MKYRCKKNAEEQRNKIREREREERLGDEGEKKKKKMGPNEIEEEDINISQHSLLLKSP